MVSELLDDARERMQSTLSIYQQDLQGMRGNRASTALVDRLRVEYYGQESELRQLANISTPEPTQILIRPYDKTAIKDIERAILISDLGINPSTDSDNIRLNMPPLTGERRQELVKVLHRRMEDARVAIRNIRRSANDDVKEYEKEKLISEDEAKKGLEDVQEMTDSFIKKIDDLGKQKEDDILSV